MVDVGPPPLPSEVGAWRAIDAIRHLLPGVTICAIVAIAATFLSELYGAPAMLFALLLGMALHALSKEGACVAGIDFAAKRLLRVAVALLGAQVTFEQIAHLGLSPILAVAAAVALTIGFGVLLARLMGLDATFGVLTGGAVAICGASAALAIAAVLPRTDVAARNTAFTVIGVTALSTMAMIAYPVVAVLLQLDHTTAGIFLGGTIHDVAQVVGAGFSISDESGTTATLTKLFRVSLLLPVVACVGFAFATRGRDVGGTSTPFPIFLIGFAALVAVNSAGIIPPSALAVIKDVSRFTLAIAIAALGIKTSIRAIADVGWRATVLLIAETIFLAAFVLAAIRLTL